MSRRDNYRSMRRTAREKLPYLLARQKNRCIYCDRYIIADRVSRTFPDVRYVRDTVMWVDGGRVRTAQRASVEHPVRLADGGTNADSNLVAACMRCNQKAGRQAARCKAAIDRASVKACC